MSQNIPDDRPSPALRTATWSLAILTVLLLLGTQLVFTLYDTRSFIDHDYYYTVGAFRSHETVPAGRTWEEKLERWKKAPSFYPPLVPTTLWLGWRLWEPDNRSYRWTAAFFCFLVIGGAAFAVAEPKRGFDAALLAFIVATMPLVDEMSRKYFLQFQANASLIWAYALVLRGWTRPIRVGRFASAVGLCTGLALATHPIAAILALPVAAGLTGVIWSSRKSLMARIGGPLLFAVIAVSIVLPWVALHGRIYVDWYLTELAHSAPITRTLRPAFALGFFRETFFLQSGPWGLLTAAGLGFAVFSRARRNPARKTRTRFLFASIVFTLVYSWVVAARSNAANACSLLQILMPILALDVLRDRWKTLVEHMPTTRFRVISSVAMALIVIVGVQSKLGWIGRDESPPITDIYEGCNGKSETRQLHLLENGYSDVWRNARGQDDNDPVRIAFRHCVSETSDQNLACEASPPTASDRLRDAALLDGLAIQADDSAAQTFWTVSLPQAEQDGAASIRKSTGRFIRKITGNGSTLLRLREGCVMGLDGVHGRGLLALTNSR